MAGGGGTYNGGVEFSVPGKCLNPMELVALTVDSGGVGVAVMIQPQIFHPPQLLSFYRPCQHSYHLH